MGGHLAFGPEVGHWTAKRVDGLYFEAGSQAIGLKRDGKLIAGVIYEHWNGRSVICHMAVEGPLSREFIWTIFDYPFNQFGVQKVVLPISSANRKCLSLVAHMGFKEESRIKDAHPTGDLAFYTMTRKECRFLGERYRGKIRTKCSAAA